MNKNIQLKISKIKYEGDSIGDDMRIEIECQGKFFGINKQIKNKSEIVLDVVVGQFLAIQELSRLDLNVKLIERDLIFNDVASKNISLDLDLEEVKPQFGSCEIEVKEFRSILPNKKKAFFIITFEITISENIRFIPLTDDGWIVCIKEGTKERVSLPAYLRVHFDKIESKKEYFTPLEGFYQGIQMHITANRSEELNLLQVNPQTESVVMIYSISKKTIKLGSSIYKTTDYADSLWSNGSYDIEIPDMPHRGGLNYATAKYPTIWFRIGHGGDRYIHTGRHSLGCITLTEQEKWGEICEMLLKARKGDGQSVGILNIVN